MRRLIPVVAVTAALFLLFLAWRRLAYASWLPNTYYAKLHDKHHLGANLRDYIIGGLFPYADAGLFASSVIACCCCARWSSWRWRCSCSSSRRSRCRSSPGTTGWASTASRRHSSRWATSHTRCWSPCASQSSSRRGRARGAPRRSSLLGVAFSIAALLRFGTHIAVQDKVVLNDVTIRHIAQLEGRTALGTADAARRAVSRSCQMPDAGGTVLVGGMQMVDNGYLTDFQMARIGRKYLPGHRDLRVLNEYQHEERRPDLVSEHKMFALDQSYLGTRYLPPAGGVLWVNRSLVELDAVPPDSKLLYEDAEVRVYLSADTVTTAGPNGLVRCELVVE